MSKQLLVCLRLRKGASPNQVLRRLVEEPTIHVDTQFGCQPIDPDRNVFAVRVESDEFEPRLTVDHDVEAIEIFPDEEIEPESESCPEE